MSNISSVSSCRIHGLKCFAHSHCVHASCHPVRSGDDRYDIGVAVKSSKGPLCVPGFSIPSEDGGGWQYSNALALVLRDYKVAHGWVWDALEKSGESRELGKDAMVRVGASNSHVCV